MPKYDITSIIYDSCFKIYLFYIKVRIIERTVRERYLPPTDSLHKRQQVLALSLYEARSQEIPVGLPHGFKVLDLELSSAAFPELKQEVESELKSQGYKPTHTA